mgnify:CR=1 FL=1
MQFSVLDMLGTGCFLQVIVEEKDSGSYNRITSVIALPAGMDVPKTETPLIAFDIDAWDDEVFNSLPGWIQERIKKRSEYQPFPVRPTINQEPQRFRSVMEGCEGHDLQAAHLELDPIRYSGNQVAAQGVGSPLTCENLHTGFDEVHNALCVVFVLLSTWATVFPT